MRVRLFRRRLPWPTLCFFFFFNDTATTEIYTLSLHDALPILSDLAASGGYYIALPGQVIVAEPGTLTGSIGIYGGKMVADGTMHKIGLNMETVASGRNAALESPVSPYTPEQRVKLQAVLQDFYG